MKSIAGKALTTGFAVAALSAGATVLAAPAHANGGAGAFECYGIVQSDGTGKANCSDPNRWKGNFAAKYKCEGSDRWITTGFNLADGSHPIYLECAPHSAVSSPVKTIPDPVPA